MKDEISPELLRKMDALIAVTAIAAVDGKPQAKQIEVLSRAGLSPSEIASLVGTTPNTVSVTLSKFRARGRRPRPSR